MWEREQPVPPGLWDRHTFSPRFPGCTNKPASAVRRRGQKAGLWARPGGVGWIKERCGKGGISPRKNPPPPTRPPPPGPPLDKRDVRFTGFGVLLGNVEALTHSHAAQTLKRTFTRGWGGLKRKKADWLMAGKGWDALRHFLRKQADGFHTP